MGDEKQATPGGYPANIDNPDDWAAFLARYLDNRATNAVHNGIGLVALHIIDAIRDARRGVSPCQHSASPLADFRIMSGRFHDDGDGTVHVSTVFRDGAFLGPSNVCELIDWLKAWLRQNTDGGGTDAG